MTDIYEDIKNIIIDAEQNLPVNSWKVEGISIWPFIRIMIFMEVINNELILKNKTKIKEQKEVKNLNIIEKFLSMILNTFKYRIWLKKLKSKRILFLGADSFRVDMDGKRFNRFFDPLIEEYNLENCSAHLEYHVDKKNNYYNNTINYLQGLNYYDNSFYKLIFYFRYMFMKKNNFEKYDVFFKTIENNQLTATISSKYSIDKLFKYNIKRWLFLYKNQLRIIKKIKPNKVFTLSYYNDQVMLLIHAANQLKIDVIEIQHGPIANKHLAYGNWLKIPEEGYSVLPNKYWCWDIYSKEVIDSSLGKNNKIKSFVGGHPWIKYWNSKNAQYNIKDNIILFSCQPEPNNLERYLSTTFVELIKKSEFKWYFRLHPRQIHEKETIIKYLKDIGLYDFVDVENATNIPLPILLNKSFLHITPVSGTTIEASLFNVHTILLDSLSIDYYSKIIQQGLATYINPFSLEFEAELSVFLNIKRLKSTKQNKQFLEIDNFKVKSLLNE